MSSELTTIAFDRALSALPTVLAENLAGSLPELQQGLAASLEAQPERISELVRLCAVSNFVLRIALRQSSIVTELIGSGDLWRSYPAGEHARRLHSRLAAASDEAALIAVLRQERAREMVRIAWRDILGHASLEETLRDLSDFADACIEHALNRAQQKLSERHGEPFNAAGEPMRLCVIGMGKLGAHELNFSSDIDLIFVYEDAGETRGGKRPLAHEEFFNRLGRNLIKLLSETSADGQVFRVDMRLRPFGDSGPLAISRAALMSYMEVHGRDWERYAWIKARAVAGDIALGESILSEASAFIYRRYIDFGALGSLREMKQLINDEARRRGRENDIKRGVGGIREIEFTGQAIQLVRGGRERSLRLRPIREVLAGAAALNLLPEQAAKELDEAYVFLRLTENRLQQLNDEQTHALPEDVLERAQIAFGLNFDDWPTLLGALSEIRKQVAQHFEAMLGDNKPAPRALKLAGLWELGHDLEACIGHLEQAEVPDAQVLAEAIVKLHGEPHIQRLGKNGFSRMAKLLPAIVDELGDFEEPLVCFERISRLLDAVATRSVYLALLAEKPQARQQMLRLCAASPWIAQQLVRQPALLDELLDVRTLYTPPGRAELDAQMHEALSRHPAQDEERIVDTLREYQHIQALRVAAADIVGELPVAEVSNHLSDIAEVCVNTALKLAWERLVERHGEPGCVENGIARKAGFAIIAYGKLGGLELGYSSDLDLVFLHDSAGEKQQTDGERSVDNLVFFTRLAQRIIHLLQTRTHAGRVYEIDARLRPSGNSGLLVATVSGFHSYQAQEAWTWEHQALVRARAVAGDARVAAEFDAIRRETLSRARDEAELAREIVRMRARMREELASTNPELFNLKADAGGITDIEFMVQYAVLRWAQQHPQLLAVTDNLRLLETLDACGLLPAKDCARLHDAYFAYRAVVHRQALQEREPVVAAGEFTAHRDAVMQIWRSLFAET